MRVLTGELLTEYIQRLETELAEKTGHLEEVRERLLRAQRLKQAFYDPRFKDAATAGFDVGCTIQEKSYGSLLREPAGQIPLDYAQDSFKSNSKKE